MGPEEDQILEDTLDGHPTLEVLDLTGNPHGEEGVRALCRFLSARTHQLAWCITGSLRAVPPRTPCFRLGAVVQDHELNLAHPQHRSILRCLVRRILELGGSLDESCLATIDGKRSRAWAELRGGLWHVPHQGKMLLRVKPLPGDLGKTGVEEVKRWTHRGRREVALTHFTALLSLYKGLSTEVDVRLFVNAVATEILFKPGQIKLLLDAKKNYATVAAAALLPSLAEVHYLKLQDLIHYPTVAGAQNVAHVISRLVHFNPNNPTGRYWLDMRNPTDRGVAHRLVLLSTWEAARAKARKIPDTSAAGDRSCLRNTTLDGKEVQLTAQLPQMGIVACDYVAAIRPDKAAVTVGDDQLGGVARAVVQAMVPVVARERALRAVSHRLVVTPAQVRGLLLDCSEEIGVWRVLVFICMFSRCVHQGTLVSAAVLRDPQLFMDASLEEVTHRLGLVATFDGLDLEAMTTPALHLDLAVYEQWVLGKFIFVLSGAEKGCEVECTYDGVSDFIVPNNWVEGPPQVGLLQVRYTCEPKKRALKRRIALGHRLLGWQSSAPLYGLLWPFLERRPSGFCACQRPVLGLAKAAHKVLGGVFACMRCDGFFGKA
eukprot:CAMPEP_0204372052 /NCGR_PEP_ID=MMETSP0469-20131031/46968_1 /ASSEMBLY_ACC=CAM_ASM_000384 /TAXON_ID=2969 /ORGANISM="Oxyrrhis marina" /LENGTH=600 /DNA_ID=CAMNT_0051362273 /DNA_START=91 /DNA_END=1891 /DNA_ORIENTATION=-